MAVHSDEELNKLLLGVTVAPGGVLSNVQAVLLRKKTRKTRPPAGKRPCDNVNSTPTAGCSHNHPRTE